MIPIGAVIAKEHPIFNIDYQFRKYSGRLPTPHYYFNDIYRQVKSNIFPIISNTVCILFKYHHIFTLPNICDAELHSQEGVIVKIEARK